jgi:hypothetical protein
MLSVLRSSFFVEKKGLTAEDTEGRRGKRRKKTAVLRSAQHAPASKKFFSAVASVTSASSAVNPFFL